jgi:hypothetical protein
MQNGSSLPHLHPPARLATFARWLASTGEIDPMKTVLICAVTGAAITGTFGYFSWNPEAIAGLSRVGETTFSAIPGLIFGLIIGAVAAFIRR